MLNTVRAFAARFAYSTLVYMRFIKMQNLFAPTAGNCQVFPRQHFDRWHTSTRKRRGAHRRVSVTVIVVFQVFEYVADV